MVAFSLLLEEFFKRKKKCIQIVCVLLNKWDHLGPCKEAALEVTEVFSGESRQRGSGAVVLSPPQLTERPCAAERQQCWFLGLSRDEA